MCVCAVQRIHTSTLHSLIHCLSSSLALSLTSHQKPFHHGSNMNVYSHSYSHPATVASFSYWLWSEWFISPPRLLCYSPLNLWFFYSICTAHCPLELIHTFHSLSINNVFPKVNDLNQVVNCTQTQWLFRGKSNRPPPTLTHREQLMRERQSEYTEVKEAFSRNITPASCHELPHTFFSSPFHHTPGSNPSYSPQSQMWVPPLSRSSIMESVCS